VEESDGRYLRRIVRSAPLVLLALVALLLLTAESCSTETDEGQDVQQEDEASEGDEDSTESAPAEPEANPDGDFDSTCDLALNSDFDEILSGGPVGWLVADAELHNTGNVGIVVRVTATFKQAGSRPTRLVKKARIPYGKRRNIHFKKPVSQEEADAFQGAPGYFDGNACSVQAKITSSFGTPQD
jgi:hypothetical protein